MQNSSNLSSEISALVVKNRWNFPKVVPMFTADPFLPRETVVFVSDDGEVLVLKIRPFYAHAR
jgi:hypothetical protein